MPIFTLSKEFEHGGKRYPAALVEASDAVYLAARQAGAIDAGASQQPTDKPAGEPQQGEPVKGGTPDQQPTTTTATDSDAETQTERTVPRRERAKNGGEG